MVSQQEKVDLFQKRKLIENFYLYFSDISIVLILSPIQEWKIKLKPTKQIILFKSASIVNHPKQKQIPIKIPQYNLYRNGLVFLKKYILKVSISKNEISAYCKTTFSLNSSNDSHSVYNLQISSKCCFLFIFLSKFLYSLVHYPITIFLASCAVVVLIILLALSPIAFTVSSSSLRTSS